MAPTRSLPLLLLVCLEGPGARQEADPPDALVVPHGRAATIDGTVRREEWKGARTIDLGEDRRLLLMHDGKDLYAGLRGFPKTFFAQLYVRVGDEVRALHASAQLGTVVFAPDGEDDRWLPGSEAWVYKEPAKCWAEDRWLASVSPDEGEQTEDGQQEFRLSLRHLAVGEGETSEDSEAARPPRLALAWFHWTAAGDTSAGSWPADLEDDTGHPRLVAGFLDGSVRFRTELWPELTSETDWREPR